MFSANGMRRVRRWRVIRHKCSELLFCLGLVLVPALLAVDLSTWLECRNLGRAACVDSLILSVAQIALPAGASP